LNPKARAIEEDKGLPIIRIKYDQEKGDKSLSESSMAKDPNKHREAI